MAQSAGGDKKVRFQYSKSNPEQTIPQSAVADSSLCTRELSVSLCRRSLHKEAMVGEGKPVGQRRAEIFTSTCGSTRPRISSR